MEKKQDLESLLKIYFLYFSTFNIAFFGKILKKDDSEFNLYGDSKTLDKLIEKAENEILEV